MSIESIYSRYYDYVTKITAESDLSSFKSNEIYRGMLEHVSFEQGVEYLTLIRNTTPLTEEVIVNFCKENDRIGNSIKYDYGFINTSPSNLRYIFNSHLILKHISSLKLENLNIVEVGGGYGGLCLAISQLSKYYDVTINKYNIIDLPVIGTLQSKYLESHTLNFTVNTYSAFNYGEEIYSDNNTFLISNYCFSEIDSKHQSKYIQILFPKIQHGFIAWNHIPVYNFGFTYDVEDEYPLTGQFNKYVYF